MQVFFIDHVDIVDILKGCPPVTEPQGIVKVMAQIKTG